MNKRAFILGLAALIPVSAFAAKAVDWTTRVTLSPIGGHVMGNPAAPAKVVEYISYTCSHCAHFVAEGAPQLKEGWVKTGKATVEVRNAVRDRYDLTAALFARCGGPSRFYGNHEALFANQSAWMPMIEAYDAANSIPSADQPPSAILKDIGRKTGLYTLMEKRGFTAKQLDACVADAAALKTVTGMTNQAWNVDKITGTPGFTLNGKLLAGTSTWEALRAALPGGPK
jgi:protein-disulfide isomerase